MLGERCGSIVVAEFRRRKKSASYKLAKQQTNKFWFQKTLGINSWIKFKYVSLCFKVLIPCAS
jgi:hypothetical protein